MRRLLIGCLLISCQTPLMELRKQLDPRSSADLDCDVKELRYKELDHLISTTKVSVTGCGKTVVYALVESRWTKVKDEPKSVNFP